MGDVLLRGVLEAEGFRYVRVLADLVHWTKWEGPHLVEPSEPWDEAYAHKPWVLKHKGVVYHYYWPSARRAA